MPLDPDAFASNRFEVTGTTDDAVEYCYAQGWTDGLPVVPPTEDKVLQFVEHSGRHPSEVIGVEPVRARVITVEKVAINAVMAGCLPEYMPVVLAAVECMAQPEFALHSSLASTSGFAPLLVINGPVRHALGFTSGHNIFGPAPDRRANATVGRAIRLILLNVLDSRPGVLDRAVMGHPGKYSYCIAEDEESSPWEPLHVERGFSRDASTVTVFTCLGPFQLDLQRIPRRPEPILDRIAAGMLVFGPGQGELLLLMPPEISSIFKDASWSKDQVRRFLFERARKPAGEWPGINPNYTELPDSAAGEMIPVCSSPESVVLLSGGGAGSPRPVLIRRQKARTNASSVIRQIDTSNLR